MSYHTEPLGAHHDLTSFDSGSGQLDQWLRAHAATATGHGTRTHVVVDKSGSVIGHFAIAPHIIDRGELPKAHGRGAPRQIPAVLLAKLALDRRVHGQGLGSELLVVSLRTITDAARRVGGRFVVVDAIDDSAVRFYEHHEFVAVPGNRRRHIRKLSTIARALGEPWP